MRILVEWVAALLALLGPTLVAVAIIGRAMRRGWWPSLLWQMPYRPVSTVAVMILLFAGALLVAMEVCAIQNAIPIAFVVCLVGTPLIALPATAFLAWWRDDADMRAKAAEIRNQRLEVEGSICRVVPGRHWPEYILDVQRVRLRARYQPPD